MKTYTTKEAAQSIGCNESTIRRLCANLGLPKHGKAYLINQAGLKKLKASLQAVGNPGMKTEAGQKRLAILRAKRLQPIHNSPDRERVEAGDPHCD